MAHCIFCQIAAHCSPAHIIWEDIGHMAFLSIFPNTEGVAVVISKEHQPSYVFDLSIEKMNDLMVASRKVAKILDGKFQDVGRTGVIFEGFGIDHVHAKLIPMHGTKMAKWSQILSSEKRYFTRYEGYISSHDGERAHDDDLARLAAFLRD